MVNFSFRKDLAEPEDSYLWDLAKRLAGDDLTACHSLMTALGCPEPELIWSPGDEDLRAKKLKETLDWWKALPVEAGGMPDPSNISPFDLGAVLGFVSLLDVQKAGEDFRYRLYGTQTGEAADMEFTGKLVSEIATPVRFFFMVNYRAILTRKEPLFTAHTPPYHIRATGWYRLILPFSGGEDVERLLVTIVPCDPQQRD
ncbi:hypothetical protein ACTL6U_00880 [Rhodovibrionaceae bacterium A322]